MSESLDQLLLSIKDELDAEQMDKAHIEELFQKLRNKVEEVLLDDSNTTEEKGKKLNIVSELLAQYEDQARQQKTLIQEGLKKLSKGRRSLKEYQENT